MLPLKTGSELKTIETYREYPIYANSSCSLDGEKEETWEPIQ